MASDGHSLPAPTIAPFSCSSDDEQDSSQLASYPGVFSPFDGEVGGDFDFSTLGQIDPDLEDFLRKHSPAVLGEGDNSFPGFDVGDLEPVVGNSTQSEPNCRGMKWTPQLDTFLVQQRRSGDTYATIAKKMLEQFGVSLNPNMLGKRFKVIAVLASKDTVVNKALDNVTSQIMDTVKEEINRLNIDNADMLDEVNEEMLRRLPDILRDVTVDLWIQSQVRRG